MTTPDIRGLIAKWRERAERIAPRKGVPNFDRDPVRYWLLRECADELEALLSEAAPPAQSGWQPIETAPDNAEVFFWVVPKSPDESPLDSSGKSIFSAGPPRLHRGKRRTWSALEKATHWMPLPAPPLPPTETE